jgi:hypothetical protein
MRFAKKMMAVFAAALAAAVTAALAGCAGVSVGQGASAISGGLFNAVAEAAIVVGRGAADVGNSVLDTVPFPVSAQASVGTSSPAVPAPPMN